MTLTIQLTPELKRTLILRAAARGQDLTFYVLETLREAADRPDSHTTPSRDHLEYPGSVAPADDDEGLEEVQDEAPWRGVFTVEPSREPGTSEVVTVQTSTLPAWRPDVVVSPRWLDADDE